MLESIRKFSNTIYAKILLAIIIIPFVFWGMGSSLTGGNKNVIVIIDKEKYKVSEFGEFVNRYFGQDQKIDPTQLENYLTIFIGEKLVEKEIENFGITLSDIALSKLIKNQKDFKRENIFSRTEYEKFLLTNSISATTFEANLARLERKKQLLDLIGGGILPPVFLVDNMYDKMNQKRKVQLLNLNNLISEDYNFSKNEIEKYYESNKNNYKEIYKTVKIIELNPKKLTGSDDFNDNFFKKIDEIDDKIIQGKNISDLSSEFNLGESSLYSLNNIGENKNSEKIKIFSESLINKIFPINEMEPVVIIDDKDKYYIAEFVKTENILKKINNKDVKNNIITNLKSQTKRKLISEIISKINKNNFNKLDFDKFSKEKNLPINYIKFENRDDDKKIKKEVIKQIYDHPEKKVIVVHDINFSENFLIYIDEVINVNIDNKSAEYKKYLNLSKLKITNGLFNTYDSYIKTKYDIDINYKTLETIKNSFN
tara:strand:+ start:7021 stop:8469 length:1449 start_codon:yes stop_codon:yes gene_type:complete